MTENTAPNTAENQRTVDLGNDDQEYHRADCTTPAVKKLKLAYKQLHHLPQVGVKDGSAVVEQFLQYMNEEAPFDQATLKA
ncbi:TPA: hypothetical protein ACH3X1_007322 [Trebouxia sp. C0004]